MKYIIRYEDGAYNLKISLPVTKNEATRYDTIEAAKQAVEDLMDVATIEETEE